MEHKPLRVCRICNLKAYTEKELEFFCKGKRYLHGRMPICKKCKTNIDHPKSDYLRKCGICGLEAHTKEDLKLFTRNTKNKYDRLNFCKECMNKKNRERRKNRPFHFICLTKKSECKHKKIPFNLTTECLEELWEKQNGKCAVSGLKMELPYDNSDFDWVGSVDRIEFDKGYIIGNVRWVVNAINTFKGQKTDDFMFKIAKAIVDHNNL